MNDRGEPKQLCEEEVRREQRKLDQIVYNGERRSCFRCKTDEEENEKKIPSHEQPEHSSQTVGGKSKKPYHTIFHRFVSGLVSQLYSLTQFQLAQTTTAQERRAESNTPSPSSPDRTPRSREAAKFFEENSTVDWAQRDRNCGTAPRHRPRVWLRRDRLSEENIHGPTKGKNDKRGDGSKECGEKDVKEDACFLEEIKSAEGKQQKDSL